MLKLNPEQKVKFGTINVLASTKELFNQYKKDNETDDMCFMRILKGTRTRPKNFMDRAKGVSGSD